MQTKEQHLKTLAERLYARTKEERERYEKMLKQDTLRRPTGVTARLSRFYRGRRIG